MKTGFIILTALMLTACSTVNAGKTVVKTTGKVAASTGKAIYKTGELTGKAVYKTGELTGKAVYKTGEATGKAIYKTGEVTGKAVYETGKATGKAAIDIGKGTASMINKGTSSKIVQDVTFSPEPKDVDSVGDKDSLGEVILTPLSDINLRKQRIPEKLASLETPYDTVTDQSCQGLITEIVALDNILGPDMDSAKYEDRDAKGKRKMREMALDVAEAGVGSFVPFRSVVRAATGAKLHENEIEREYRKGVARRSYLRGLASSQEC